MRSRLGGVSGALVATIAASVLYRLVYFVQLRETPALLSPVLDADAHLEWARGVLAGTWPGPEPFFRAPGYVYALAAGLRLWGDPATVAAVQIFAGVLTPVLVALLGARLFGVPGAWIAGLGGALYPMFPFFDGQLLVPTLALPLMLGATLVSLTALERRSARWFLAAGLLWGAAGIVRPPLLVGGVISAVFAAWGPVRAWRGAALTALGALVLPLAVTAWNGARGDPVFIASQGGLNFYLGNGAEANGIAASFPELPTELGYRMIGAASRLAEEREGRELKPSEVSRHYVGRAVEEIAESPGRWAALLLKKALLFWFDREIPNNHDPALFAERVPAMRWVLGWGVWAPLGVVGFWLAWRRRESRFVAALVLGVALGCVVFFVNARFRIPAAPLLIALGSGALVALGAALRERRVARAAVLLLAVGSGVVLMRMNPYAVPRDVWVLSYVLVAEAEKNRGEPVRALDWIERALEREPSLYAARVGQVDLLRRAGRIDEARAVVERCLDALPEDAYLRNEYGVILDLAGRSEEALAEIERAIALDPDLHSARVNRGIVLSRLGRADEAREVLGAFLREHPSSPETRRARAFLGSLPMPNGRP